MTRRQFLTTTAASLIGSAASAETLHLPAFRIIPEGWGEASLENLTAVARSTLAVLWRYFPNRQIEPFVITHVSSVPMVHYERNARHEIILDLATEGMLWCQFAYQLAHEFCHILANFDNDGRTNLWFEETLCETASLFTLRHLAQAWEKDPPYPNWQSYAPSLTEYAAKVVRGREKIPSHGLARFHHEHEADLRANPMNRALNGSMAVWLLELFEQEPAHWEAITWLNSTPSPVRESFTAYLAKWIRAAPGAHQPFIAKVRAAFGIQ